MIIKTFELVKINLKKKNLYLLYGSNEGFKKEVIEQQFKKSFSESTYLFEESEVLQNKDSFFNSILSNSFFEKEKLIIISRVTDKMKDVIEEILEKKIEDLVIVLNAGILEKKSKLRALFEKEREMVCIPFYEDNNQTLSAIVNSFFRINKIAVSQESINLIIQRCRGDRQNLQAELEKIKSFSANKKRIDTKDLLKLTNLAENYSVSELIDSCLAKNKKKTINILNENNYSLDDCIIIIRTFLMKSKKLLQLIKKIENEKNIDQVISNFKPPIFWKDKEIIKIQIKNWSYKNIENLIYDINDTELLIKKNSPSSINILNNFIINQTIIVSN
jgi:DNA polymerase-3 subunit delta